MQIKSEKNSMPLLFGLLASVPVLFRGIFFENEYFIFAMIAALSIILALCFGKSRLITHSVTDYVLAAFVLCYILTVFSAVSLYSAILEISKYILFFLLYLLAKNTFDKNEKINSALNIIMYVLAFSGLYTLLSATGILGALNFPGAYSAAEHERWLQGTVQYHNTFGILMLVGFFMACGLNTSARNSGSFFANGFCAFLFMFGLLMSYSRGAWILVPVLFAAFLFFATSQQKIRFFATGIASLASVLTCMPFFAKYIIAEKGGTAFWILLLGIAVFAGLYYVSHLIFDKWSQTKNFKKVSISILLVLIVLAVLVVFFPPLTNLLPAQLADRLSGISLGGETVKERFVFYRDAFELYKNHNVIIGNGGNAWAHLYGMYQSYDYASNQAHSYIMQVLVEAGALGFIFWICTIVLFFVQCFKARKSSLIDKNVLAILSCTGFGLILHSFIDFDLSLPAVLCMLWIIIGMLNGIAPLKFKNFVLNKWIGVALAGLLIVFALPGWIAFQNYTVCNESLNAEDVDYEAVQKNANTAASIIPFNGRYASLALRLDAVTFQKHNPEKAKEVHQNNRYEVAVLENLFYCYEASADYASAYACVEDILKLQPTVDTNYLSLTDVSKVAMIYELKNGRFEQANQIAKSYLGYKDDALRVAKKSGETDLQSAQQAVLYAETLLEVAPENYIEATEYMLAMVDKSIEAKESKEMLASKYGEYAIVTTSALQALLQDDAGRFSAMEVALALQERISDLELSATYAPQYSEQIDNALQYSEMILSALGGLGI